MTENGFTYLACPTLDRLADLIFRLLRGAMMPG